MKIISSAAFSVILATILFSCQKQVDFEVNLVSAGSLAKDAAGNCSPITINGIYKVGTVLAATTHYADVSVHVTATGSYQISTDTINGIHFGDTAQFTGTGLKVVRLKGKGNPISSGHFMYTAHYNGTSSCAFAVTVSPAGTAAAVFTLAGAAGACTTPTIQGTYTAGTILNATNKIIVSVDVTSLGDYTLHTIAVNGIFFSASGTFTATGVQTVTLSGTGTPLLAGVHNIAVSGAVAGCNFPLTVAPAGGSGSGTKVKRIIQSEPSSRKAYITTLTYDAGNRLLTFKEWEEDSAFTPIKISGANYSSFMYNGSGEFPVKNTITDETARVDSTLYTYDALNRVTKEEYYHTGHVSVRNTYTYGTNPTVVVLGKYVLTGPALSFRGNDSLIFDAQKRITEMRSYDAANMYNGYANYLYDAKVNPFAQIKLFDYAYTLYCDDAKFFYRSPNNMTSLVQANLPSSPETLSISYTSYNAANYPLTATASISYGATTQHYRIMYEYY